MLVDGVVLVFVAWFVWSLMLNLFVNWTVGWIYYGFELVWPLTHIGLRMVQKFLLNAAGLCGEIDDVGQVCMGSGV